MDSIKEAVKNAKSVKVLIGQVCITRTPNLLESVLGSCIGLVIYDPVISLAGMAHILLPDSSGKSAGDLPGKYADHAVLCLKRALVKHGGNEKRLKAKYAGGAKMFSDMKNPFQRDIGSNNINAVQTLLREYNIPVVSSDTGGSVGRRVCFAIENMQYVVEDFAERRQVI